MPSGTQIKAARVLADWSAEDLAERVGISKASILNIEHETFRPRRETLERIESVFAEAGVEFLENDGIRRKVQGVEIFEGHARFQAFTDTMYQNLIMHGGDVYVSATDERLFAKYRRDHEAHRQRMKVYVQSGRGKFLILAHKSRFVSDYAQHRWMEEPETTSPTAYYIFGKSVALISFSSANPPYVMLMTNTPFAEAYRKLFEKNWTVAKQPPSGENNED